MIILIVSTKEELRPLPTATVGAADIVVCAGKIIKSRYAAVD